MPQAGAKGSSESSEGVAVHEWGTAPEFVGPRHALRESLLLRQFLAARPGRAVLDVGAGGGTFAQRLRARGFDVTVADPALAAVEVLRRRGFAAFQAEVEHLPFETGRFDAVVMGEVLEHVDRHVEALREVARVLVPGGVVAVSVPRNPAWFAASDRWAGHVRRYTRDVLLGVVEEAGFTGVLCRPWGFPVASLYHRWVFERHLARHGPARGGSGRRPALALLAAALQVDRLFVGFERGALGYLLTAVRPDRTEPEPGHGR